MSVRKWKLVVTEVGVAGPVAETVVEAANWMAGIKVGRGKIGEPEAIPHGASCTVAPDGKVTVFDATRRRSYVLSPALDDEPLRVTLSPSGLPARPSTTLPPPGNAPVQGLGGSLQASTSMANRPARPKTVGFVIDGPLPSGTVIPVGQPAPSSMSSRPPTGPIGTDAPAAKAVDAAAQAKAAMRRTMAFVPGQFDLPPLPTREVVVGGPSPPASADGMRDASVSMPPARVTDPGHAPSGATSPSGSAARPASESVRVLRPSAPPTPQPVRTRESQAPARPGPKVLFERHVPPNDESPLYYDVVGLFVGAERDTIVLERIMLRELDRLRAGIQEGTEGHLIQVFLYPAADGAMGDGTEIAQLTYRGWRREAHLRFPGVEEALASEPLPEYDSYPAAREDERLDAVFAAFDDIWFLATPKQGLEFSARLCSELWADAHILFAGLSRVGDTFLLGAEYGGIPGFTPSRHLEDRGLVGLARKGAGRPVVLPDPTADPRVELPAEGVQTGPLMAAVGVHGGAPLAYVRVARRKGQPQFKLVDAELLRAVMDRLALFMRLRGATLVD